MELKESKTNSYNQILRSSSIIGGAQGINYLISMLRIKIVAVLLGPSGVGLIGLYASLIELVGALARLGVNDSGVREIAEAHGKDDSEQIAKVVKTLRRICWITGILGWLITGVLSYPLSVWVFGTTEHAWTIIALGSTVLLGAVSGGQISIIQGTRRIGDLARMSVLVALIGTIFALGLYSWLGEQGIAPVIITTAAVNLGFSWWFAKKIEIDNISLTWLDTLSNSKRLIKLGLAFMYGMLLSTIVMLIIRAYIVREFSLNDSGVYQAAWGLSGMFAGFIIGAMGTDFYPRLTAVSNNNEQVNKLVNEQIYIGVLLALPGLLATMSFAQWLVHLFYSADFLQSAELLPLLIIGTFAQIITFPIGFIQRAKGKVKWIILSQTHLNVLHLSLALLLIPTYGIVAAAWAFALSSYIHGLLVFAIARHLSKFAWTFATVKISMVAVCIIITSFIIQHIVTSDFLKLMIGFFLTIVASLISLRGISFHLGKEHRIIKFFLKVPGGRLVCGL